MSDTTWSGERTEAFVRDGFVHAVVDATGSAGDVYLVHPFVVHPFVVHPFVVHSAQPHRGTLPRFMAQPPLEPVADLDLDRPDGEYPPVERAVRLGFDRHLDSCRRRSTASGGRPAESHEIVRCRAIT